MSRLLLDDKPLIILPTLAEKVGLNESIVLQQLHYWLKDSKNIREGHKWVYNTYEEWRKQFPFWSVRTLKRIITELENNDLIITGNFNKLKIDRTKWYRINHEKLDSLMDNPECQSGTSIVPDCHNGDANLSLPLPEITTETTTEKKIKKTKTKPVKKEFAEFVKMTESEFSKLVEKYGESLTCKMIEVLDNYKGASNKTYDSDYRAILLWVAEKVIKEYGGNIQSMPKQPQKEVQGALSGLWGDED